MQGGPLPTAGRGTDTTGVSRLCWTPPPWHSTPKVRGQGVAGGWQGVLGGSQLPGAPRGRRGWGKGVEASVPWQGAPAQLPPARGRGGRKGPGPFPAPGAGEGRAGASVGGFPFPRGHWELCWHVLLGDTWLVTGVWWGVKDRIRGALQTPPQLVVGAAPWGCSMLGMEVLGVIPFLGVLGGTPADLGLYLVSLQQSRGMNFIKSVSAECLRPKSCIAPLNPKSPQIRVCHRAQGLHPAGAVQRDLWWPWGHLTGDRELLMSARGACPCTPEGPQANSSPASVSPVGWGLPGSFRQGDLGT